MQRNERSPDAVTDYAICMLDGSGIVTGWSPGAQRIMGYRAEEIIGEHFLRFYTEDDNVSGLPVNTLERATRDGKFEGEGWRIKKDGSRFWAHVVIDPIYSRSGGVVEYANVTRDLTEHKASDEALRLSEEQFKILVQGVTDYAIYMLDLRGNVITWNTGAQRIKGYPPSEIIGQHFSRFYTQEDLDLDLPNKALETALEQGRFENEGWRVRKDGTRFWASVIIDAVKNETGELVGFAKVTRDVTDRNHNQQELARAREALFQSQKMETIGQLTGGVAHDFNNLLMAILGSLELLRRRLPDDRKTLALLDNAMQGAQRGATLTKRMLAFARRQKLHLEPVDVPALVRGMADLLERSLGSTVVVETLFPLSLAKVQTDPNQLELALLNLAVNARDAMPNGGTISIAARTAKITDAHSELSPGDYICLSVNDEGEGMDDETLGRSVEPFFTTKGVGKGTGLGLSMVHGIMKQSDGQLVLQSEIGKGTRAELWLPVIPEPMTTAAQDDSSTVEDLGAPQSLTILAVDDDALVLMNTVAMLEELGHTVIEAGSGRRALELLRSHSCIDLVLTDQAMPNMTGTQLIREIQVGWPDMPVILATGYSELPDGAGKDISLLSKPFMQSELSQKVSEVMLQSS
ncbi:hybrid sensor histidine kinase/response regulator [Phyllobacterium chamaecytisi]|uniref:hybrid sensor histidine kinase/response regulator n=1 Tax=Phyllobacterium chamaecytisi TaxID=2876082 RepID=UPI001CCC7380|nr:PAS domain-containing sensor histidine kinase [Phyllobacterium sp. KW56]MBZ9605250.1 PAS domain S-box protein [Phyllobacterium sp. KW56]